MRLTLCSGAIRSGRMLNRILAGIFALIFAAVALPGRAAPQPPATYSAPGLAVGAKAPEFKLVGQDGKEHALADLLRKGKLALVFQRSADW